jgi:hypothetical protein
MRTSHRFTILFVIALALALAATLPATASAAKRITFREVASGSVSRPGTGTIGRLLRTERTARQQLVVGWMIDADEVVDLSTVDFSRRAVVVILGDVGGRRRIGVDALRLSGRTLTATVSRRPGGGGAADLSRPWTVVSVPRSAIGRAWPDVVVSPAGPAFTARSRLHH